MLRLKRKLQVNNVLAFQSHHYVPLVTDNTLLSCLKESIFLHQFQGIEYPSSLKLGQKYSGKAPCSNALDDLEICKFDVIYFFVPPNGFDFE
jgi:hypothetical protein